MEYLKFIVTSDEFQTIFKLLLSCFLTGIIGIERSTLNKPADFGTHTILGVSATLSVICSEYLSSFYSLDVARIPAAVLTGIGFIGAGSILKTGTNNIKGITTASGIFAVTCIGLCVGSGYYIGAIIATIIVYLLLAYSHNITDNISRFETTDLYIELDKNSNDIMIEIEKILAKDKVQILRIDKKRMDNKNKKIEAIEIEINYDTKITSRGELLNKLISLDNVLSIETDKE